MDSNTKACIQMALGYGLAGVVSVAMLMKDGEVAFATAAAVAGAGAGLGQFLATKTGQKAP